MPALWTSSDYLVLELLGLPPLSDAGQTKAVIARRQNSKPRLPLGLVQHNLHTDPASLLLRSGHGEGELHVVLVFLETVGQVESPLVEVSRVKAVVAAVVADLSMDVGAAVPVPALPHLEVGADEGLGLAGGHLHARVGEAGVDHLGPAP